MLAARGPQPSEVGDGLQNVSVLLAPAPRLAPAYVRPGVDQSGALLATNCLRRGRYRFRETIRLAHWLVRAMQQPPTMPAAHQGLPRKGV